MGRFDDWLACPDCDGSDEVSVFAHRTDLVIECYECGRTDEFRIGSDMPFHGLDERTFATGETNRDRPTGTGRQSAGAQRPPADEQTDDRQL